MRTVKPAVALLNMLAAVVDCPPVDVEAVALTSGVVRVGSGFPSEWISTSTSSPAGAAENTIT